MSVFDFAAEKLESRTDFDRLEARGTVRLALKSAGLAPAQVTPTQMAVVIERVLPHELRSRGIPQPECVCAALVNDLKRLDPRHGAEPVAESPEAIFRRLTRD